MKWWEIRTKMPSFSKLLAAAALVASATADFHLSRTFETVNNINGSVSSMRSLIRADADPH